MYFDYIDLPFPLWGTVCWVQPSPEQVPSCWQGQNEFMLPGPRTSSSTASSVVSSLSVNQSGMSKGKMQVMWTKAHNVNALPAMTWLTVQLLPTLLFITPISWPESKRGANSHQSWQILKPGDPYKAQPPTLTSLLNPCVKIWLVSATTHPTPPWFVFPSYKNVVQSPYGDEVRIVNWPPLWAQIMKLLSFCL